MSRIGRSLLLHGDVLTVDEVTARMDAVTDAEVSAVAREMLTVDPVIVTVGPVREDALTRSAS